MVIASVLLFLAFTRLNFKSKFVNYCATSAFSVYLIHVNPYLWDGYKEAIRMIYDFGGELLGIVAIFFALVIFLFLCIAIDKIRIWLTPLDKICNGVRSVFFR